MLGRCFLKLSLFQSLLFFLSFPQSLCFHALQMDHFSRTSVNIVLNLSVLSQALNANSTRLLLGRETITWNTLEQHVLRAEG